MKISRALISLAAVGALTALAAPVSPLRAAAVIDEELDTAASYQTHIDALGRAQDLGFMQPHDIERLRERPSTSGGNTVTDSNMQLQRLHSSTPRTGLKHAYFDGQHADQRVPLSVGQHAPGMHGPAASQLSGTSARGSTNAGRASASRAEKALADALLKLYEEKPDWHALLVRNAKQTLAAHHAGSTSAAQPHPQGPASMSEVFEKYNAMRSQDQPQSKGKEVESHAHGLQVPTPRSVHFRQLNEDYSRAYQAQEGKNIASTVGKDQGSGKKNLGGTASPNKRGSGKRRLDQPDSGTPAQRRKFSSD